MTRASLSKWVVVGLAVLPLSLPSASASVRGDAGFGNLGTLYVDAKAILPLPGGDIAFATSDSGALYVWRVASDGAYRTGSTRVPCAREQCVTGVSLARDSRGRIVVATGSRVVRLLPSGVVDVAFGDRGTAVLAAGTAIGDLAATGDAILVAGSGRLTKLASDGAPDASFGEGGVVALPADMAFPKVVVQRDGRIIVGGGRVVMRLLSTGAVDSTYGDAGRAATERLIATALALQSNDKLLAGGRLESGPPYRAAVFRVGTDGRLDSTFGVGGVSPPWPPSADWGDLISAVGVQPGGGVVVGGIGQYWKQTTWFIHRLRADGTSDGRPRVVTGVVDPERDCWGDDMSALAVQRDGKVITSGWTCFDSRVVRFLPDLRRDQGRALRLERVPNWARPAPMRRQGKAWVASLRVQVDYPADVTVTVRKGRLRLPLLRGSTAGRTVLRRTARSMTGTRTSAGALGIRVLVPAGPVRAGGEYSFVVEAADRRDRTAALEVRLVAR